MANRRMFSKSITSSSRFLMMPSSAQCLYFHLGMNADDDGYCEHFTIMRMTDSKPDDLNILRAKEFVIVFDDRVLIIKDWKENNYLRNDRYTPSKYLALYPVDTFGIPDVSQEVVKLDTQVRLGKVRLGNKKQCHALAVRCIELFNEISTSRKESNNPSHLKRCLAIIKTLSTMGITADDEVLSRFRYVYENQRKIADDDNTNWDKKHYKFDTLTRHDNFFNYLGTDSHDTVAPLHPCQVSEMQNDQNR